MIASKKAKAILKDMDDFYNGMTKAAKRDFMAKAEKKFRVIDPLTAAKKQMSEISNIFDEVAAQQSILQEKEREVLRLRSDIPIIDTNDILLMAFDLFQNPGFFAETRKLFFCKNAPLDKKFFFYYLFVIDEYIVGCDPCTTSKQLYALGYRLNTAKERSEAVVKIKILMKKAVKKGLLKKRVSKK